jgi:hypothetical protein
MILRCVFAALVALFASRVAAQSFIESIEVAARGGASLETWHGQVELGALKATLVHPLSPRTDLSFVVEAMSIDQPRSWFGDQYGDGNESVRALAAALLLRRTFNQDSTRIHYFVDGGTGPMFSDKRVPAATSRFNFVTQASAGIVLLPDARVPVLLGYRFLHISNGGYAPRNPGLNVSSLEIGFRFRSAR